VKSSSQHSAFSQRRLIADDEDQNLAIQTRENQAREKRAVG
jgi:hypothetical protein